MKDAFFGCHESYRFPFPPFVLHLSPVLQGAGFSGFSGLLGFEKKKKKNLCFIENDGQGEGRQSRYLRRLDTALMGRTATVGLIPNNKNTVVHMA